MIGAGACEEMRTSLSAAWLPQLLGTVRLGPLVAVLLTVSLPQMIGLFSSLDSELPVPTKVLIAISETIRGYPEYILLSLLVSGLAGLRFAKSNRGRTFVHKMVLVVPMVNKIVLYNDISKFSDVLSSLLESGMPIDSAMDVAKDSVANDLIRSGLGRVAHGLESGEGIAQPMRRTKMFPATYTQSIEVAENTGSLSETLARLSRLYREEARTSIKSLVGMVQPLSTIFVALIVGFIAISVIMPMYTALGQFE